MKIKQAPSYEIQLFMGCRKRYDGPEFSEDEIANAVAHFQKDYPDPKCPPVRVTRTRFIHKGYREGGFELAVIRYPRYEISEEELWNFMWGLGKFMLDRFDQNKVSIVCPETIYVLEADDAQEYSVKWVD